MIYTEVLLNDTYFPFILSGEKSVDARINKPSYETIEAGSLIKFVGSLTKNLEAYCRVTKRNHYKTFREMLEAEGLSSCLPGIATVEEGVKIYLSFPGYEAQEKSVGVVAFQITPLR